MWLLEAKTKAELAHILAQPISAEDRKNAEKVAKKSYEKADKTAIIPVKGVLTPSAVPVLGFFGVPNTGYDDIQRMLTSAETDPSVEKIVLDIDSPGGTVAGVFDTAEMLQKTRKPVTSYVSGMAASAAYILASQGDEVVARNITSEVGSIGVVQTWFLSSDKKDITSTNAPNKRPDPSTEDGEAQIRAELDEWHAIMVDTIAFGRKTTAENVDENYGQGGTFLAQKALERGMVDRIENVGLNSRETGKKAENSPTTSEVIMDKEQLKAEHPSVYAEIFEEGKLAERDRAGAHLTMGTQSGDLKTAHAAILDGSEMTMTLQSAYMAAAMNKRDVERRESESVQNVEAPKANEDTFSKDVLAQTAKNLGVKLDA